jgi:hypothetical protein
LFLAFIDDNMCLLFILVLKLVPGLRFVHLMFEAPT